MMSPSTAIAAINIERIGHTTRKPKVSPETNSRLVLFVAIEQFSAPSGQRKYQSSIRMGSYDAGSSIPSPAGKNQETRHGQSERDVSEQARRPLRSHLLSRQAHAAGQSANG